MRKPRFYQQKSPGVLVVRTALLFSLLLMWTFQAFPSPGTFEVTVRLPLGAHDSEKDLRKLAILKVKNEMIHETWDFFLEETSLGDYLNVLAAIHPSVDELNFQIRSIISDILSIKLALPEWKEEKNQRWIILSGSTSLERESIDQRIGEIIRDEQLNRSLVLIHKKIHELTIQLETIKIQLDQTRNKKKIASMIGERKALYKHLSGVMWCQKGLHAKNSGESIKGLTNAITQDTAWYLPLQLRGLRYFAMGEYGKAIADLQHSLGKHDNDRTNLEYLGYAYFEMGDYDQSVKYLSRFLQTAAPETKPYLVRARAFVRLGSVDNAITDFTHAISLDPFRPGFFLERGKAYELSGNKVNALSDFEKAISLDNHFIDAYLARASLYFDGREMDHALKDVDSVLTLQPDQVQALLLRGGIRFSRDQVYLAGDDFQSALQQDSTILDTYPELRQLPDTHSQAIAYYRQRLGIDLDDPEVYESQAENYLELADYEHAIEQYTRLIELDSTNRQSYRKRALACLLNGDFDRAVEDANRMIELDSLAADGYDTRAMIYRQESFFEWALADHNSAITLDPENAEWYFNRAKTYELLDALEAARRDYYRAQRLGHPDAQKALNRIWK